MGKLTDRELQKLRRDAEKAMKEGQPVKLRKIGDGDGLQLVVAHGARVSMKWVLRFMQDGKAREMGLGSYPEVGLAQARDAAFTERKLARGGVDPIAERKKGPQRAPIVPTFGEVADEITGQLAEGFRNEKHKAQWRMTLTVYAGPLRAKPVNEISTEDVLGVLKPLWQTKPETASRLRGRIEKVLNAAKAKGLRIGENPATWRGHLDHLLPKQPKLTRGHHAALDYQKLPEFMGALREREAVAARCLEFAILTAARSGEALGARWSEIDGTAKVWTISASRMKAGRDHRVPLSDRAFAILDQMKLARVSDFIFPGQLRGRPLSVMALEMILRRMDVEVTVHGFRSTFRDWAGNETHFPRELAEHALAHAIGDKAEQAYRRSDALEKRRALMAAWAAHSEPGRSGANVIDIRAKNA